MVEEESQNLPGCPVWTGPQGPTIPFFLSPMCQHAGGAMARRGWHIAAQPARGLPINFSPKSLGHGNGMRQVSEQCNISPELRHPNDISLSLCTSVNQSE